MQRSAPLLVGIAAAVAILLPAVVVELAEDRAAIGEVDTAEFLLASVVLATIAGITAAALFRLGQRQGHMPGDLAVAAVDGVIATAIAAVMALVVFLLLHLREGDALGEGVGVQLLTWTFGQAAALAAGVLVGRAVLRWVSRSPGSRARVRPSTTTVS
jgi:hypothetical protein